MVIPRDGKSRKGITYLIHCYEYYNLVGMKKGYYMPIGFVYGSHSEFFT